jgi:L-alanine-DL-glutamate epimerase-like enolase superfamily enzyme
LVIGECLGPLALHVGTETWPLKTPFRIAGHTWDALEVLIVTLTREGHVGRGEAAGVYYKNDTPPQMLKQICSVQRRIEAGIDRESLQALLPPGGARNALDCALWDLEAKLAGLCVWQAVGLEPPKALLTTFTCGADTPDRMAAAAKRYAGARAIKLKLTGEPLDTDRVRAVREACSGAWLGVDANQAFSLALLEQLMPVLVDNRVTLIEQPLPVGQDEQLRAYRSSIPIAADESAQCLADVAGLIDRYQVVNIKLDKCGGLTEALAMARCAHDHGLQAMVGNMLGTSLAMAPAYLVGQLCLIVDLDGPVFLSADRTPGVGYTDGMIVCPSTVWG